MNKTVDERLIPDGEYIDALNIRLGSTEASEVGSVENSKGNTQLTSLQYIDGSVLSSNATCIGAYDDGEQETMYWFIHDNNFTAAGVTGKLDLIVSYNTTTQTVTYHVISIDDGGAVNTTLNFSGTYLITGINLVDNLLFFTDDLNQPRRINITKNYDDPVGNVDTFAAEDILVIKAPPINSPSINPISVPGEENFLEDRIICFGYRYKYEDNEYSAISQFSAPSFAPEHYDLSSESYLNEGMVNSHNACQITFNSGGPLVVGVDLLFKEMTSDNIKVIEKMDKAEWGYSDDTDYTITFANSKIYTVLPSSEILRLYDNVPLLAKAQTVMGNRLMYGNYVDGWNLTAASGYNTQFNYETSLLSEEVGFEELSYTRSSSNYTFGATVSPANSQLNLDLTNAVGSLKTGATIDMTLAFNHTAFAGAVGIIDSPIEVSTDRQLNFLYTLTQNYNSVTELWSSADFQDKVGIASNILPVYHATDPTSCSGLTLTDRFNCAITDSLQGGDPTPVYKFASGITTAGGPVLTTHVNGSNVISFQFPAMQFVSDVLSPTIYIFEYYTVSAISLTFSALGSPKSLHSNRGYEVGMVYMDEFNRATTALVSRDNTVHVGCSKSADKNEIRVTIPPTQVAPSFATRYKFVIKPDKVGYNTVYTSIFFYDPITASDYFLLQGENAAKVEEGDRLIVKRDVDGPVHSCKYATVLEKKSQVEDFIEPTDALGEIISVPQGVYMQIRSSEFNSSLSDSVSLTPGTLNYCVKKNTYVADDDYVQKAYNFSALLDPDLNYPSDGDIYPIYDIPTGSRIRLKFKFSRKGTGDGNGSCERRIYTFDETYTSSETYANIIDWWNGDNIGDTLNDGEQEVGGDGCDIDNVYITPTVASTAIPFYGLTAALCTNYFRWYMHPISNEIRLALTGTRACGNSDKKKSCIKITIEVIRAENTIVFETEPQDALADVWYESSTSYAIDASGNHSGNVTNQNISGGVSGVVDTAFFNCFTFGNGVESYKIRDSITGRAVVLGNRVTTVAAQDFKEADRFADMTYSGVFNNESNVNKLNEFNLGLLNFKVLEESFGPIEKMVAQETNILILQEDKISYVLASKNLISDSTGGGVVASVPEILGTQIARVEEFGISNNPESFAQWGASKYFSDAKRGSVIQLSGSGPNEALSVVSEAGMRSWFRDMFISNFNSQKLGGYDPYMNEYVLGNNTTTLPEAITCIKCGVTQSYYIPAGGLSMCYDVGEQVGDVPFTYTVEDITDTFSITVTYSGTTTVYGPFTADGTFNVNKGSVSATQMDVQLSVGSGSANVSLSVGCPEADEITVVLITITNDADIDKLIHNQYRWTDGFFVSPTHSNQIQFLTSTEAFVVSQYDTIVGPQGAGIIPATGATVSLISNKVGTDDFDFDIATDKFRWLRSSTLYNNTPTDIATLLPLTNSLVPTGTSPFFSDDFSMPSGGDGDYLYLVWDYAPSTEVTLCYDAADIDDACCVCVCGSTECTEWLIDNTTTFQVGLYYKTCAGIKTTITLGALSSTTLCVEGNVTIISGPTEGVDFTITECGCT
ncbi:MAG TPA: hypothetical protein EYO58_05685 [Flavobacteriales bacterium]|nr:hypothetical protein [Flavobacteriales bacterium]